jgi:hypothetical protein
MEKWVTITTALTSIHDDIQVRGFHSDIFVLVPLLADPERIATTHAHLKVASLVRHACGVLHGAGVVALAGNAGEGGIANGVPADTGIDSALGEEVWAFALRAFVVHLHGERALTIAWVCGGEDGHWMVGLEGGTCGWMVGWMDGWMDGWLDGWMVGWVGG